MKEPPCHLLVAVAVFLGHVGAQVDVIENIGFGQAFDSVLEGETKSVRVRLGPEPTDVNVSGRIVPLSLSQYMNYNFATLRTVPQSVQDGIAMNTTDPAEYDDNPTGKRDFNNTVINFTIPNGTTVYEMNLADIVKVDDVNEATEQFILVLEIESDGVEFDEFEGILVVTILDDNPIFLVLNASANMFDESDGKIESIVSIQKENGSPATEVDITVQLVIENVTVTLGDDIQVMYSQKIYTILRDDMEVEVDPITIVDDNVPETNETFTLSLMRDDSPIGDTLNVSPQNIIVIMTILDDDEAKVNFTKETYNTTEGEDDYVEVCITLSDGVSLDSSLGTANFSISTTNTSTASADADYDPTPEPTVLTIMRGQEIACSNITIRDDTFVEAIEEFDVSINTINYTFSAGVNIVQNRSTVQIEDDDGAIVGFNMTAFTGREGDRVVVCVTILSPNMSVLVQSSVEGQFTITSSSEADVNVSMEQFTLSSTVHDICFNVLLVSDDLIEDTENNITLLLQQSMTNTSFGIRDIAPNTATITVLDEDFAMIGFSQSSYTVSEESGNSILAVCVQLFAGKIAPGTSVTYRLEYDDFDTSQRYNFDSMEGAFFAGMDTFCHNLTVLYNNVVEPDGRIVVEIKDPLPNNTVVNGSMTSDIAIVNDDTLIVYMVVSATSLDEGGSAMINVSYDGILHSSSSVAVDIDARSRSERVTAEDYELSQKEVTLTSPMGINNITLHAVDDNMLEDKYETISITLDRISTNVLADIDPMRSEVVITIVDNERAMISFQVPDPVTENFGDISFYVVIENFNAAEDVSIRLSAEIIPHETNATEGLDYEIIILRGLVFRHDTPAQAKDIRLNFTDDSLVEGHEVINISLTQPIINGLDNPDGARLKEPSSILVVIIDDDEIDIGFTSTNLNGTEGEAVTVCIKSYGGTLSPGITLNYIISAPRRDPLLPEGAESDTAIDTLTTTNSTEGGDYTTISIINSLTSNRTTACVTIQLVDDTIVEFDEVFLVQVEQARSSDDLLIGLSPEYTQITIIDNDEIMIGFEMTQYQFSESAGSLSDNVTIVRENPVTVSSSFDIIVTLQPSSTAMDGDDFSVPGDFNVTITFAGDDDRKSFPLDILNDAIGEGNEAIELLITTPGDLERVRPGTINTTTIVIIDDDFIQYRYTESEYSVAEDDRTAQVCVIAEPGMIDFVPGGYLTLRFSTSNQTATAVEDYLPVVSNRTVRLTNDSRVGCTNVTVESDVLVEGQETFELYFETEDCFGSYVVDGSNVATITIRDSNVADVGFQSLLYTVYEGEEVDVTLCVAILSGELTDVVSLNYTISSVAGTATENADYVSTVTPDAGTLSLNNNVSCHSIDIFDDISVEPPETVLVSITATGPSQEFINLFNITVPQTTLQIVDNDSLSVGFEETAYLVREDEEMINVCLTFQGPLKNDSFVELAILLLPDTADGDDFSEMPVPNTLRLDLNSTVKCVSINITNDIVVEGTETFFVQFNETDDNQINIAGTDTVTVTIEDDEEIQLEFAQASYTFTETTSVNDAKMNIVIANYDQLEIENVIVVTIYTSNMGGNATESDYEIVDGEVRINVNENSTFIRLSIADDSITEGVEMITPTLAQGRVEVISTAKVISAGRHTTVFIEDDDVATIGFSETSYTTAEQVVMVCVRLISGNLQDNVVIRYSISQSNTTASASDFVALREEGQITSSEPEYCHSLTIVDDDLVESSEELLVNLLPVFNIAEVQLVPNNTTVTINDADAVRVGFRESAYSVEEVGTSSIIITIEREDSLTSLHGFSIKLSLNSASNATEDVDFTINDGGSSQEISFNPMEMSKEVTLFIHNDEIGEGNELIILDLVTDVESNVINVNSSQRTTYITIIEDDMIPVSFTKASYTVDEGDSVAVCAEIVSGNLPPGGTVDLQITLSSITAIKGDDYVPTPEPNLGTLNVDVLMTCFDITTAEDMHVEGTEEFSVEFSLTNRFGSFIAGDIPTAIISIIDDDKFEVGFEQSVYVIDEADGVVDDVVSIVKLNENILQMHYNLTIHVFSMPPFPATLNEDYEIDVTPPLLVTFETVHTRINLSFTLIDDIMEEGYENFTLQLSYNETDEDGTVLITPESAVVSIKDDDVVVIGFERSAYVVFEGQAIEVCVSILDRELTNDDQREFSVRTTSLLTETAASKNFDYVPMLDATTFISRSLNTTRRCFDVETIDDDVVEQPEKLEMRGTAVSHIIEFNPSSTIIWIIDDESLLLPVPDIFMLNCTSLKVVTTLTVTCKPSVDLVVAELLCSVDGEPLELCTSLSSSRKRAAELHVVTFDLLDYMDGLHILEIVGLTQVNDILRTTLNFYGLGQPFELECVVETTESGLIDVSCETERVLESLTCTVDDGDPEICALNFMLDPDDYDRGNHTVVVTATNLLGETTEYTFTFDSSEPAAVNIWQDREFVAAIAIAGVAFIILLLLLLTICLLIRYHRRVSKQKRYNLDHGSGGGSILIENQAPLELNDYGRIRQPQRPSSLQSQTSSSSRPQSPHSQASFSRPLSQASTIRVSSPSSPHEPATSATTFHVPPPPPPPQQPVAAELHDVPDTQEQPQSTEDEKPLLESELDTQTEEELLLATSGSGGSTSRENRGLKISRRHSVELDKDKKKTVDEEVARAGTFSGAKVIGIKKSGAYSIAEGKMKTKEWEAEMQREFEEEIAREKDRERVRMRERRREMEQRERRREREQLGRDYRALERQERERRREAAKEKRLALDQESRDSQHKEASPTILESPESFL